MALSTTPAARRYRRRQQKARLRICLTARCRESLKGEHPSRRYCYAHAYAREKRRQEKQARYWEDQRKIEAAIEAEDQRQRQQWHKAEIMSLYDDRRAG